MYPSAAPLLTWAFVALTLAVVVVLLLLVRAAAINARRNTRRDLARAALVLVLWLAVSGGAALSGALADFSLPPKLAMLVLVCAALSVGFGMSSFGAHLAMNLPLWALIAVHGFRLPLEMLMHHAYESGVMPVQMSYSGQNYDIVTGVLGLVLGGYCYFKGPSLRLARLFNIVGFALLLTVVTIAVLSMPLPIRLFTNEPANTWVGYFPFVWLPTVLVMTALVGHILILRRLAAELSQKKVPARAAA